MTTISDLPTDLVEEILSRIPSKHMREVRLTCRKWESLSTSESFTKMRIGREETMEKEGESRMILLTNDNLYLMSIFVDERNPSTEIKRKLTSFDVEVKISLVFHCEGLLLCVLKDDKTRLVVWNPFSGQTRSIHLRYCYTAYIFPDIDRYNYALGYNKDKSHKILSFLDYKVWDTRHYALWYEIYDFDSCLWTTLDVTPQWRIDHTDRGVSLKGNTYWFATKRNSTIELIDHIICFDFTIEQFGPLLPLPFSASDGLVHLSCVKEEKLAALYYHEFGTEIWITTKIEPKNMSWSKFLTLNLGFGPDHHIDLQNLSFFIDEVKKVAMLFEKKWEDDHDDYYGESLEHNFVNIIGVAGDIRQVDLGDIVVKVKDKWTSEISGPHVCSYVPGLVQIKQPARGKKGKQSISETIRAYETLRKIKQYEEEASKTRKQKEEKASKRRKRIKRNEEKACKRRRLIKQHEKEAYKRRKL